MYVVKEKKMTGKSSQNANKAYISLINLFFARTREMIGLVS
jgi:hypothetical protein